MDSSKKQIKAMCANWDVKIYMFLSSTDALHLMNEFAENVFNLEADLLLERYKDRWHDDQMGEKALGGLPIAPYCAMENFILFGDLDLLGAQI